MTHPELSLVVPAYNEESVLRECHSRLSVVIQKISASYEILFINDGSSDATEKILREISAQDPHVKILSFSRNFGHQIAVKAGIDHASGDALVIIDADLQDPPELILEFWKKWKEGYDVVYAVRVNRKGETYFKKATSWLYYSFLNKISSVDIPRNTGDYRLISRRVADVVRAIHEKNPYLRGLISWAGFRQIGVPMHRDARFAGKTKYSLKKLFHLAWSGVGHFSFFPLHLVLYFGGGLFLFALGYLVYLLFNSASGLPLTLENLILFGILFIGSIQLLGLGILGIYLARNYDEARPRPLYILKNDPA